MWLNGTHGAGKTTTSALVQELVEHYWREISAGLAHRSEGYTVLGPSLFRQIAAAVKT